MTSSWTAHPPRTSPTPAGSAARGATPVVQRARGGGSSCSVRAGSVPQRSCMGIGGHQRSPAAKSTCRSAGLQLSQLAHRQAADQLVVPEVIRSGILRRRRLVSPVRCSGSDFPCGGSGPTAVGGAGRPGVLVGPVGSIRGGDWYLVLADGGFRLGMASVGVVQVTAYPGEHPGDRDGQQGAQETEQL